MFLTASAGAWVCAKNEWIAKDIEDWLAAWRAAVDYVGKWPSCCTWGEGQTSTWSVTASVGNYGQQTVSGESRCSSTNGTYANPGNPSTTNGEYCWCKMTSPRAGSWIFYGYWSHALYCSIYCADYCAYVVLHYSDFRGAVLK